MPPARATVRSRRARSLTSPSASPPPPRPSTTPAPRSPRAEPTEQECGAGAIRRRIVLSSATGGISGFGIASGSDGVAYDSTQRREPGNLVRRRRARTETGGATLAGRVRKRPGSARDCPVSLRCSHRWHEETPSPLTETGVYTRGRRGGSRPLLRAGGPPPPSFECEEACSHLVPRDGGFRCLAVRFKAVIEHLLLVVGEQIDIVGIIQGFPDVADEVDAVIDAELANLVQIDLAHASTLMRCRSGSKRSREQARRWGAVAPHPGSSAARKATAPPPSVTRTLSSMGRSRNSSTAAA